MTIFLTILILALLSWKGYYAWKRGVNTWRHDRKEHDSLLEYLLGNGATERQALRPFLVHALERAFRPLLKQWQVLAALAVLIVLLAFSLQSCDNKPAPATQGFVALSENKQPSSTTQHPSPNTHHPSPDLTDVRYAKSTKPLKRMAYKVWYSEQLRIPMAVAWYLTKEHTYGKNQRQNMEFHPDDDIRNAVTTYDYMQTGYDRGHMCPAGDNKWNAQALEETFLMTNVCPQNHNLNKNDWNDLEQLCRHWARKYGKVYIVCGPVLRGTEHKQIGPRTKRITVPEAFYKVVLRMGKNPTAIGFVYDNKGKSQPMEQAVRSVDDIERMTGLDFFSSLDDPLENKIEAQAELSDW